MECHNLTRMYDNQRHCIVAEWWFDEDGYHCIEYPDGKPRTEAEELPYMDRKMRENQQGA